MRIVSLLLACGLVTGAASSVRAQDGSACESCRMEDEQQAGAYTDPDIPQAKRPELADPRGRVVPIPIPGAPTIRHRPGAGVHVGEVGEGNNVFLKPGRDKVTLGLRRDF